MKTIDMRFDLSEIKNWIGKQFIKYRCDAFDYTNSVTQIVGIYIDDEAYSLTNIQEEVDYYGNLDDIAVYKLSKVDEADIKSAFKDVEMISTPVKDIISSIKLVNENQKISINGKVEYDVWLTRAIIIAAGEREISFEKDIVPFSEEIVIRRGYDLIEKCSSENAFLENWDEGIIPSCSREVVEVNNQ